MVPASILYWSDPVMACILEGLQQSHISCAWTRVLILAILAAILLRPRVRTL